MREVAAPALTNAVYVRPKKPRTAKLALVGFCQGHRDRCPYDDPDMTVVGLNKGYIFMPRADIWYEMHGPGIYRWPVRRPHKHLDWLKAFSGPVYMHVADPDIPNSMAYPLEEVAADIGRNVWYLNEDRSLDSMTKAPYLTSSIAYQLALAIHERYQEIHLYGIDLNTDSEYAWQKPGVEFLLGVAAARGIKVVVPDNCALLHGKLYGRGFMKPEGESITVSQYETRLASLRKQRAEMEVQLHQLEGATKECGFLLEQMPPGLDAEKLHDRLKQLEAAKAQTLGQCHQLAGKESEITYWISMTPEGQDGAEALAQLQAPPQIETNGHSESAAAELVPLA